MGESAKRQSDNPRGRGKRQPASRDASARDRFADKSKSDQQAQKEAALTQPQSPGEPAGGSEAARAP